MSTSESPSPQPSYKKLYRNFGICAVCLFVVLMFWLRGSNQADVNKARMLAQQTAIRKVLGQDKTIGQQTAQKVGILDKYWDGSGLVYDSMWKMDAIDLSDCPQDFQVAYRRHVAAWQSLASLKASNEGFAGAIKGFFTAGTLIPSYMSGVERAIAEVESTFSEVQQSAIQHGVAP